MPRLLTDPTRIPVPGGKRIDELVGLASSGDGAVSVAHMEAPAGWTEPFQTPEFLEVTIVVRGLVTVECEGVIHECQAGEVIVTDPGERIRYGVGPEGAAYYAICLPAFSPERVHRDEA